MKKLFNLSLLIIIALSLISCGETSKEDIKELYCDASSLVDELGSTTAFSDKEVFRELQEEADDFKEEVNEVRGHKEIKSKLLDIYDNINESCKYSIDMDINSEDNNWNNSVEHYEKASDILEEVNKLLE
mgnify:FL=1